MLVEGEEQEDPIAEETHSLLDGHIVLSDKMARAGRFPAIDVLASRSRTMNAVVSNAHRRAAEKVRSLLALYEEVELLIRVGEYCEGRDAAVDEAVSKRDRINQFLYGGQGPHGFHDIVAGLEELAR